MKKSIIEDTISAKIRDHISNFIINVKINSLGTKITRGGSPAIVIIKYSIIILFWVFLKECIFRFMLAALSTHSNTNI